MPNHSETLQDCRSSALRWVRSVGSPVNLCHRWCMRRRPSWPWGRAVGRGSLERFHGAPITVLTTYKPPTSARTMMATITAQTTLR